jgi:putative spermidine/putrescine transport system permease protein
MKLLSRLAILFAALWTLAPLVPVAIGSLGRGWFWPELAPDFSLSAYAYALSSVSGMPQALGTSLALAIAVGLLSVAVGAPAAWALSRLPPVPRAGLQALLLAPAVVPGVAVAMGLHGVAIRLGLAGTLPGVALVHLIPAAPYAILVATAVFRDVDPGQVAAARTLGAAPLTVARRVVAPLVAPGLAAAFALAALVSWSQVVTTQLVGGGRVTTLPLLLVQAIAAGRTDLAGVAAVLTVLPAVGLLALAAGPLARLGSARRGEARR